MTQKRKRYPEHSGQAFRQFVVDSLLMLPEMLLWLIKLTVGLALVTALTVFILVILPQLTGLLLLPTR